jgi:hypothetical protein
MRRAARRDAVGSSGRKSDRTLAEIGREFPGWQPWRSSAGRWWAVRQGRAGAPLGVPVEWARTVDGDTSEQLREALTAQEGLAGHA